MFKTLTYFSLFITLFSAKVFAQELRQGLYYFNGGLASENSNARKYIYGVGLEYRYSKSLDIVGLGFRHNYDLRGETTSFDKNQLRFSYGFENSDTLRYGLKYPFYGRLQHNLDIGGFAFNWHISDRFYPEFYSEVVLHFISTGLGFKHLLWEEIQLESGAEISRLWHRDHNLFGNYYVALQKFWNKKFYFRAEYVDVISNNKVEHLKDWLITGTIGYIY